MRTIVVFSGAGLSQESGVPTFRDANGLWENHKVEDVASQEGWQRDKQLVLNFYAERMKGVGKVEPNPAHKALAKLEEKFKVYHITQNIDDLLERAGCTNITHLHGVLTRRKCEWHHDITTLDGCTYFKCDYKADHTEACKLGEVCPKCGGQMRPDVVWFGEAVKFDYEWVRELVREVKYNDGVFICVGTSAQVYPAAALVPLMAQVKNKYIVDKKPIKVSDYTLVEGPAGETMQPLVEKLLAS